MGMANKVSDDVRDAKGKIYWRTFYEGYSLNNVAFLFLFRRGRGVFSGGVCRDIL